MTRRIITHREQVEMLRIGSDLPAIVDADGDGHPDLGWMLRLFGCSHTHGGRCLPGPRMGGYADQEARLADPTGWSRQVSYAPSGLAVQGAQGYTSKLGLANPHSSGYANVMRTPGDVRNTGRAYDSLPDFDPGATRHWDAMAHEVGQQYDHAVDTMGIRPEFVDYDPYRNGREMVDDLNNNRRLKVLGTHVTGGHPYFDNATNDKFRFVHDLFGHAATGRDFDRHGEQASYLAHSRMFSPNALPALATETRGQNSSLILNGSFAPQKIAPLPSGLWHTAADTGDPDFGTMTLPQAKKYGPDGLKEWFNEHPEQVQSIIDNPTTQEILQEEWSKDGTWDAFQNYVDKYHDYSGSSNLGEFEEDPDSYLGDLLDGDPWGATNAGTQAWKDIPEWAKQKWGVGALEKYPGFMDWGKKNISEFFKPDDSFLNSNPGMVESITKPFESDHKKSPESTESWEIPAGPKEAPQPPLPPMKPYKPPMQEYPAAVDDKSPMFPGERPLHPENRSKYYYSPNEKNPSNSSARPEIQWHDEDFEEDDVLPGMPTENSVAKLYRGEPIDLYHPGAADIRHMLFGDQQESGLDASSYYDADKQLKLPGMRQHEMSRQKPGAEAYENPELGKMLLDHWEQYRGHKGDAKQPAGPRGLGRHWTVSPSQADDFAEYSSTGRYLPTRFEAEWDGTGEDPYRTNTGGDFPHEAEITQLPGAPMKITDVQVRHPQNGWVSAWPKGYSETRYAHRGARRIMTSREQAEMADALRDLARLARVPYFAPMTDDEYQQHLDMVKSRLANIPEDMFTHNAYAGNRLGYNRERWMQQQLILREAFEELSKGVPANRQALLMGGLSGSGKSTVLKNNMTVPGIGAAKGNFMPVDADYFKQKLIDHGMVPKVEGLSPMELAPLFHQESSDLAHRLAQMAYRRGINVAWDGTLRNPASAAEHLSSFQKHGYTPHGAFVDIPLDMSYQRANQRHKRGADLYRIRPYDTSGGRIVPQDFIAGSASPDPQYNSINRVNFESIKPQLASHQVWDNSGEEPVLGEHSWGDQVDPTS